MQIEVKANPNCGESEQFVFRELEPARPVWGLRVESGGQETSCDVMGVEKEGRFVGAMAAKIADSGAGYAYLIYGAEWGIRLRPREFAHEPWDLKNSHQWGEPFKIYGDTHDILYVEM